MQNQVAIITGAGSGIGRALAIELSHKGIAVMLVGRTKVKLDQTVELLPEGAVADVFQVDITKLDEIKEMFIKIGLNHDRIDALFNIAGYASQQTIAEASDIVNHVTIETNLTATMNMTHYAWHFLAKNGGFVGNVSSMASVDPFPGFGAYAAAKAGVNMFTKVTSDEGAVLGIKSVAVAPGAVETPMLRSMFDETMISKDQTLKPEDVAQLLVACMTGDHDFVSGQSLVINSGNPPEIKTIAFPDIV